MLICSFVLVGLIEQRKCAGSEEIVKERITKLQQQWEYLVQKSNEKSQHLKESNQQQQFNTNVKELDFWLGEVMQLMITHEVISTVFNNLVSCPSGTNSCWLSFFSCYGGRKLFSFGLVDQRFNQLQIGLKGSKTVGNCFHPKNMIWKLQP